MATRGLPKSESCAALAWIERVGCVVPVCGSRDTHSTRNARNAKRDPRPTIAPEDRAPYHKLVQLTRGRHGGGTISGLMRSSGATLSKPKRNSRVLAFALDEGSWVPARGHLARRVGGLLFCCVLDDEDRSTKLHQRMQKEREKLPVRELNPGHPRDRRVY